jgi:hypothetical protein
MLEHRRQIETILAEAEKDTSPRSVASAAEALATDARRLLSRLRMLEERADQLEAQEKLTPAAETELFRRLHDGERALARVRQAQIQLTTRYPDLEADPEDALLDLAELESVFILRPGQKKEKVDE